MESTPIEQAPVQPTPASDLEALRKRERAVQLREMRLQAQKTLHERALPEALCDALCYDSPESLARSLDSTEAAFRLAVENGVLDRMRGQAPVKAPARDNTDLTDEEYYNLLYTRKGR